MSQNKKTAITPTRAENYPEWYQQVIKSADLAEISPVRGCMVIKPWGYAIWENIQKELDRRFKATGHKNAYFPLFIPMRFLQKEAQHVDGFAKECAVVTHSRLESDENGQLKPGGELEEPLIVRPTSETIIGELFSKWVQSHRDLPLLINQWANVVRWEMRTRLFLRTTEFLWQEGHTAHSLEIEAMEETKLILNIYEDFCRNYLAMPVITGEKSEAERFPGAEVTFSIEAMMQDKKALQAGTSHFLGQNFSKSSEIKFLNKNGNEEFAWTTSWGVSTRLVGGLIMSHSDDNGLVLPPAIAPSHVVIIPIIPKSENRDLVLNYCKIIKKQLESKKYLDDNIRVELDQRDIRGGEKTWSWIKKGVPIRVEIGPRDIEKCLALVARRDQDPKDKLFMKCEDLVENVCGILESIQKNLYDRALEFRNNNTSIVRTKEEFDKHFSDSNAGFAIAGFCLDPKIEHELAKRLKISVRCIPCSTEGENVNCIFTSKKGKKVIFGRSY